MRADLAGAQPRPEDDSARVQAFVESLRRDDPAAADRYVALRDARTEALAELRRAEAQYRGAGPELRAVFVRGLRQAQVKYAEAALAVLDFHDARDRALIRTYQDEIGRIGGVLERRHQSRAELEKLRAP